MKTFTAIRARLLVMAEASKKASKSTIEATVKVAKVIDEKVAEFIQPK